MSLLTPEEMIEVTGAERPSKQIEVLEANRIGYIRRINGHPTTTWEAVNSRLIGRSLPPVSQHEDTAFNLGALN